MGASDLIEEVCLGWSMFPVFLSTNKQGGSLTKSALSARKANANSVRLPMYEGSPRALFSLSKPTAGKYHSITIIHVRTYMYVLQ